MNNNHNIAHLIQKFAKENNIPENEILAGQDRLESYIDLVWEICHNGTSSKNQNSTEETKSEYEN